MDMDKILNALKPLFTAISKHSSGWALGALIIFAIVIGTTGIVNNTPLAIVVLIFPAIFILLFMQRESKSKSDIQQEQRAQEIVNWREFARVQNYDRLFGIQPVYKFFEDFVASNQVVGSIWGDGGVGKTTVVHSWIAGHEKDFNGIAWYTVKDDFGSYAIDTLALRFSNLVRILAIQLGFSLPDQSSIQLTSFLAQLNAVQDKQYLIVVDNFEGKQQVREAVENFLSQIRAPHKVIITTRHSVRPFTSPIEATEFTLKGLDLSDTKTYSQYLLKQSGSTVAFSDADMKQVFETSQGNPYLVQLIVSRVLGSGNDLPVVIRELEEAKRSKKVNQYLFEKALTGLAESHTAANVQALLVSFCSERSGAFLDRLTLQTRSSIPEIEFGRLLESAIQQRIVAVEGPASDRRYSIHSLLWHYSCNSGTSTTDNAGR